MSIGYRMVCLTGEPASPVAGAGGRSLGTRKYVQIKAKPPIEADSLTDATECVRSVAGPELPTGSDGETTSAE